MRAVIIGGGISGLSTAYYLNQAGIESTIVEKSPMLGGVVQSRRVEGCLLECGPDSYLAAKPWATQLIQELGLGGEVINSNDHQRKTFVMKHGRLIPLPDGLMMMVPTKVMPLIGTPLLGWGTKIRMGLEFFRRPPAEPKPDRSVYDFLMDHYNEESVDYLAEPLLSGVYGGDPKQLSVGSVLTRFVEIENKYGSLSRGVLQAPKPKGSGSGGSLFRTLKGGLATLVERLAPKGRVIAGAAERVDRTASGWRIRANGDWVEADSLVIATPAHQAAELIRPASNRLGELLAAIPYTSSLTMSLGYRRSSFGEPPRGFGFLIPKKERRYIAACTYVNNKFSYRVPDDWVALRCFMGSDALGLNDVAITESACEELKSILGIAVRPDFVQISRWPNSMPQYTVGHAKRMAEMGTLLQEIPNLCLAGNAYQGIGLPDCVRSGQEAARKLAGAPVAADRK